MTETGEQIFYQAENPPNTFLVNALLSIFTVTALLQTFQSHTTTSAKTHACFSLLSMYTGFCSVLYILKTFLLLLGGHLLPGCLAAQTNLITLLTYEILK